MPFSFGYSITLGEYTRLVEEVVRGRIKTHLPFSVRQVRNQLHSSRKCELSAFSVQVSESVLNTVVLANLPRCDYVGGVVEDDDGSVYWQFYKPSMMRKEE